MKTALLIKYYANNLSFYHLVIKKNKALKNAILIILSILDLSVLAYFFYFYNIYGIVTTSLLLVIVGVLGRLFNVRTIRKLYSKEIKTEKFSWNTIDFDKMVFSKIEKYLVEAQLQNKQSLELVINIIEEKLNAIKIRTYSIYSIVGIILLPIWNSFVSKNINENNNEKILMLLIFIGCIIAYGVLVTKNIAGSLNVQLSQMKKLKFYLQEILISKT